MNRVWTRKTCPLRAISNVSTAYRHIHILGPTKLASRQLPRRKASYVSDSPLSLVHLIYPTSPALPNILTRRKRLIPPAYTFGTLMMIPVIGRPQTTTEARSTLDGITGTLTDNITARDTKWRRVVERVIKLLDNWLLEPLLTLRRFIHIVLLFTPVILTSPALVLGEKVSEEDTVCSLWWYGFLGSQMERAGPSFIKLAQWIASRTDLFPMALCQRLGKLHSNVDPHPFSYTRKILEASFGRPLENVFMEFDPEPLGVGAIAQVYKAKLRPEIVLARPDIREDFTVSDKAVTLDCVSLVDKNGQMTNLHTAVAIKVIHPKARQIVRRDLNIMLVFATILDWIPTMHWLSLPDEVRVFGAMMKAQLDLRIEGQHLDKFNQLFQDNDQISFPRPFMYFTSRDILVEEYENGIPLGVFLRHAAAKKTNNQYQHTNGCSDRENGGIFDRKIASIGLNAFLYMLIVYNFVHADLHPGNIMIKFYKPSAYHPVQIAWSRLRHRELKDDGDFAVERVLKVRDEAEAFDQVLAELDQDGYVPRLVMIDTGLVNELNDRNRKNFLDLFGAVAKFDGYRVGELMVERCQSPEQVIQPEIFALRMQNLILGLKQHTFHLGAVKIGALLSEVRNMVRKHHVKLEADFINVVVGIMLLEGIGRQLDPDLDLFKNALPVLRKYSLQDGGKNTIEGMKDVQEHGFMSPHWIKVWIFLELRNWLTRNTRENEWLKLCDILCFNN